MKRISSLIIISISAAAFAQAQTGEHAPVRCGTNVLQITPALLNDLADEMREKHPALLAARARTNAAAAGLSAIRSWEDPMARVGGVAARETMRASDGDIIYGVDQKLPVFGKPRLARRVAQADLAAETAQEIYQFQLLKKDLAKAAFRAGLADEVIRLGAQDLTWLQTIAQTVERKYAAGQATLVEVSMAENERAKRATQLQTDGDNLAHERVSLNRLLNRDLRSPWPVLSLPPLAGQVVYNEKLVRFALKYEPRIKLMRQQISRAEAAVELTRRQRLPDVSVGLEGRNYSGDGSFRQGALVLSMGLPWFNAGKYRSEVARDQAKLKAAELDLTDYEFSVREDVHHLAVKIDAARREALLYRDEIIPRSDAALESARSGWESNRGTFRDVLDARRMWVDGQLMYARALAEQYQMLSELVLCCGLGDLGALQMIEALPEELK
jgi:cobalt-zinc-cadmium efflux system outer membrane protein